MMVRLRDVAQAAGVDLSTASYALSGKGTISAATRDKVLHSAQRLGYRPNLVARSLAKQQTHTIGLVLTNLTNPFYGEIAAAAERAAHEGGYRVVLVNASGDEQLGQELLDDLVNRRVEGIIAMAGGLSTETVRSTTTERLPIVWCMWEEEDVTLAPAVGIDCALGGHLAAAHLLALGHRRVAIVAHKGVPSGTPLRHRLRLAGYADTLAQAGYPLDPSLRRLGDSTVESGRVAGHSLLALPEPPSAIFATNDLMALGVLAAARERKVAVPDELSVIGFDNIALLAHISPPLTTIDIDKTALMGAATALLLALARHEEKAPPPLRPNLVIRESTGPARLQGRDGRR